MMYFLLAFVLVLLDQWLKFWVVDNITLYESIDFIPHVMELTYIQNTGAAFSVLSGNTMFLAVVSLVMSVVLAYLLATNVFSQKFGKFSLALVLGGAVGNLLDRAFRGFVVDMFSLLFVRFAIFNIADVCVVVGGIFCGIYYVFLYDKYDAPPEELPEELQEIAEESAPELAEESAEQSNSATKEEEI